MNYQDALLDPAPPAPGAPPAVASTAPAAAPMPYEQFLIDKPEPKGLVENFQAGWQGSSLGLIWRGRLPELIASKENQTFWEGAASGFGGLAGDLLPMIAGSMIGAPLGAAAGAAITKHPLGALGGGILGSGAGMGFVPSTIREAVTYAYRSGEIQTKEQFWQAIYEAAQRVGHETAVSSATFGAAGVVNRATGRLIAPMIGKTLAVPTQQAGAKAVVAGGATRALEAAELANLAALFPVIPAALEGRLPSAAEFGHSFVIIGGMKGVHEGTARVMKIYEKTGRMPAEVVADSKADPTIKEDLTAPPEPPRAAAADPIKVQEQLFTEVARLDALEAVAKPEDQGELTHLRARVASLEAQLEPSAREGLTESSLRRVYDDVQAQMRAAGRPEDEARAIATLESERVRSRAERLGKDPWELYREGGLKIRGPEEPPSSAPSMAKETAPTEGDIAASRRAAYDMARRQSEERNAERAKEGLKAMTPEEHDKAAANEVLKWQEKTDEAGETRYLSENPKGGWYLSPKPTSADSAAKGWKAVATFHPKNAKKAPAAEVPRGTSPEIPIVNKPARPITDPEVRPLLEMMGDEAGWLSVGGKLDIARYVAEGGTLDQFGRPEKLGIVAFTQWIPRAEWWSGRPGPGKLNERQTREAIRKALAGEKLKPSEQRAVAYMLDVATRRLEVEKEMGSDRFNEVATEIVDEGLDPTTRNVVDFEKVDRAAEKDPDGVERAAVKHQNDDAAFMAEIRRILGEQSAEDAGRGEAPAGETLYQLGELQRYLAWRDGIAFERKLFGGSLDASYAESGTRAERSGIAEARKRYNLARQAFGLPEVADWSARPERLIQQIDAPARFEQQQVLFQHGIDAIKEPDIPDGMVRLYRGGGDQGNWFSTSREVAEHFMFERQSGQGRLTYIDVSEAKAFEYAEAAAKSDKAIPDETAHILPAGVMSGEKPLAIFDPKTGELSTLNAKGEMAKQQTYSKVDEGVERGSFTPSEKLIRLMGNADRSTAIHELGHDWLEEMKADAMRPDAPAQIKADWETLRRELAIPASGDIATTSHEQWARSIERYVAEGKAPSAELAGVFQRFKEWMLAIYRSLTELNVTISPEMREVMDRMLATDQQIADAKEMGIPRAYVEMAKAEERRKIVPGFVAEQISMRPFADELPKGPGEAPDNSHVNYKYVNSPMNVKLLMEGMAEIDQVAIQKQRGGPGGEKSWEQSNIEQAKYVNDILGGKEDTLRLFTPADPAAGPDVRLGILKKIATGAAKDSARLRDVILEKGPDATVVEQLEYMGSIERARMIQAEFLGERAGVARALNALKDTTEGSGEIGRMLDVIGYGEEAKLYQAAKTPAEVAAEMKAKLDEIMLNYHGKTVYDIAKLHKEIGTLKGSYKFAKATTDATTWEMVVEGWKSGLLSGPVTPVTNIVSTAGYHGMRPIVDLLGASVGMLRGAKVGMGEADRQSMQEAVARVTGWLGGTMDALKVGYHVFKLDEASGKTESFREAIPGRAGEWIRIPLRLMSAGDAILQTMYTRGELKSLSVRQAFEEKLNPMTREFAERVDYLMEHPTTEMAATATSESARMSFNAPLGEKGRTLQLMVNRWNLQWMMTFIRTPINIFKETARMSPFAPFIGEWRADVAKGGVARDRAIAELTLGTGIMALAVNFAFEGVLTGTGDPDPGKRRTKNKTWQAGSWLIGDTYYEIARLQPMGTLLVAAADMAMVWDHMTEEEMDKIPKMLAMAFSNAVTNQTFLQGISGFMNAMSEPQRFVPKMGQQMAGSLVPNIVGQTTRMSDPYVRQVNGMLEAVQARIPGWSDQLMAKVDWLGEKVETKERAGLISPVRMQKVSEDKVRLEADRLGISVGEAPKKIHIGKGTGKIGDVEITPEQRNKFAEVSGKLAHDVLTPIVNGPAWDALPDLAKRRIYARVLQGAHRAGAIAAFPPELREAAAQQITQKMQIELQPMRQTSE